MKRISLVGCFCALVAATGHSTPTNEQTAGVSSPQATSKTSTPSSPQQDDSASGTNSPITLPAVTVTGDLDKARDQIAPSLGAVTFTISPEEGVSSALQYSNLQRFAAHA